jgi:DNA-binding MarR family transcriptional regulator
MPKRTPREPEANTATLLLQAHLHLADRINAAVIARGFPIRPAHASVFIHMDTDGIRLTRLAEKAQMAPQSMAELVDDLVDLGYLERAPDPTDRRAKLIVFTNSGRDALQAGLDVVAEVEMDLMKTLGKMRSRDLRATLEEIVATGGKPGVEAG